MKKGPLKDVIEKMRSSYAKASDKHLVTYRKDVMSKEEVLKTMTAQFLRMSGYTDKEISKIGSLADMPAQQQEFVRRKMLEGHYSAQQRSHRALQLQPACGHARTRP